jgi:tetratricopeptide (TPR) repeat protein
MRFRVYPKLILLPLLLSEATGWAQPAAPSPPQAATPKIDVEQARQAYAEGETAYKLGKFDEAAKRFEVSYEIMKSPPMLFTIGQCYRRLYEQTKRVDALSKALDLYRGYLREAAPTADRRVFAQQMMTQLEKALGEETQRRRQELLTKAVGREGLFLADQLLADGATRDAVLVVDRVLAGRGNPRDVIVSGLGKRAILAGQMGEANLAVQTFERLFTLDPAFALPDETELSTKQAYHDARMHLRGQRPLAISHIPPGGVSPGQSVKVPVKVEADPLSMIDGIALFYRLGGGGAFSVTKASPTSGAVEIPSAFLSSVRNGARVEYYVGALDANDGELATLGTAKEPFVFVVGHEEPPAAVTSQEVHRAPPWYKRAWPWVLIVGGAGVVGAAVGLGVHYGMPSTNATTVLIPTN